MAKVDEFADFHPPDRPAWRGWLAKNHDQARGIWFVYYKKSANRPRVSYDEAVEEALCYGWIDSLPRKLDEERSKLLFTPRKARSVWSKPNKERVARLIETGRMTAIGLAKIEAAKLDGSWNALDRSDNLEMPPELAAALVADKSANENFEKFPGGVKRVILQWIFGAKREATKTARIAKTVRMAAQNKRANFDAED